MLLLLLLLQEEYNQMAEQDKERYKRQKAQVQFALLVMCWVVGVDILGVPRRVVSCCWQAAATAFACLLSACSN